LNTCATGESGPVSDPLRAVLHPAQTVKHIKTCLRSNHTDLLPQIRKRREEKRGEERRGEERRGEERGKERRGERKGRDKTRLRLLALSKISPRMGYIGVACSHSVACTGFESDWRGRRRWTCIFSQPAGLYRCATVVKSLVKDSSTKNFACQHSLEKTYRHSYNFLGKSFKESGRPIGECLRHAEAALC